MKFKVNNIPVETKKHYSYKKERCHRAWSGRDRFANF